MYYDDGGVRCVDCRKLYGTSVSLYKRRIDKASHEENMGIDIPRSFR